MLGQRIASLVSLCGAIVILQVFIVNVSGQSFECTKTSDCNPSQCCRLGMTRFSVPTCVSYGNEGDSCLMNAQSQAMTLTYPNGLVVDLTDTYTLFCPCNNQLGLSCVQNACRNPMDFDPLTATTSTAAAIAPDDDDDDDGSVAERENLV